MLWRGVRQWCCKKALQAVLRERPLCTLSLALAACGRDDGEGGAAATQTTPATRTEVATTTTRTEAATTAEASTTTQTEEAASAPLDCLEQAGLSNPEQRDADFWRGGNRAGPADDFGRRGEERRA
ncbi:MAG: hypothetical protein ACJ750_03030 [Gaiellaceae bacterium]